MDQLSFRLVDIKELNTLQELSIKTFRDTYEHLNDPIYFRAYLHQAYSLPQMEKEVQTPKSVFYFALLQDKIVGFFKLNFANGTAELEAHNSVELERIYLIKEEQGKGLGAQLIQQAIQKASRPPFEQLWLGVWKKNPRAIHFYQKQGFSIFGEHEFYVGLDCQEDYLMQKKLHD